MKSFESFRALEEAAPTGKGKATLDAMNKRSDQNRIDFEKNEIKNEISKLENEKKSIDKKINKLKSDLKKVK